MISDLQTGGNNSVITQMDTFLDAQLKISDDIDLLELNNDYDKYRYITR